VNPPKEGEISGDGMRFRYREHGGGDAVLWLGELGRSPLLREIVAKQSRVVELAPRGAAPAAASTARALAEALATLGITRFDLVAEDQYAAVALALALDRAKAVTSLTLLAPVLIDAKGGVATEADEALVARLATLEVPLLAVFGTKDTLAPPEAGRHYRDRLANCNLVLVYDAGHAMGEERPEAVAELVTDFLRRRDLFLVRQTSDLLYH